VAPRLFHASDRPDIAVFEPRPAPSTNPSAPAGELVWAVDEPHLPNYLLPRDCPRVTFARQATSQPADVERLLGGTDAIRVVAIESGWLARVRSERLYLYELPPDGFALQDAGAGYYVARQPVRPIGLTVVDDLLAELAAREVELRVTPSLHRLRDAVVASSLEFSIIRWRNAAARPAGG
jgi:hypothetical protein